jgi:isopentenyl-diphosphate Delta-isomerase
MEDRKKDHIELAFQAQTLVNKLDNRFIYEPFLAAHPTKYPKPIPFLGHMLNAPLWVSSMTGGTQKAKQINHNLAKASREFGLGMGLGSCRVLLDSDLFLDDFDVRKILGHDTPLFANLGIGQVEQLVANKQLGKVDQLVNKLQADGLIIHVNPFQEWFQPEGDRFKQTPLETIEYVLEHVNYPIIVKEVGQGIGYESLRQLLRLPLAAIEFGAFGGTNFSEIERLRNKHPQGQWIEPLCNVGVSAEQMVDFVNKLLKSKEKIVCKQLIISGGIKSFLDGYYLTQKSELSAIYGQASSLLQYSLQGYEVLAQFIDSQLRGFAMAEAFLRIR